MTCITENNLLDIYIYIYIYEFCLLTIKSEYKCGACQKNYEMPAYLLYIISIALLINLITVIEK